MIRPPQSRSFHFSFTLGGYIAGAAIVLVSFILRTHLLRERYLDLDELEHLQASFLISQGLVPHKDFFEHHNHLLHYLLLPLVLAAPRPQTIIISRGIMLGITAGIILLTYRMGRRLAGPTVGLIAAVFLSLDYVFLIKTIEVRPDTPAALLLLAGMLTCFNAAASRSRGSWVLAGFILGLAFLCTQKMIFPLGGIALGLAVFWFPGRHPRQRQSWGHAALFLLGLSLPFMAQAILFAAQGALPQFLWENIIFNLHLKRHFSPLKYALSICFFDPFLVIYGAIGIAFALRRAARPEGNRRLEALLPPLALGGGIAGAMISPVVYAHYYASLTPLLALFAAWFVRNLLGYIWRASRGKRASAGLLLPLPVILPASLYHLAHYRYDLPLENVRFWMIFSGALAAGAYLSCLPPPRKVFKIICVVSLALAVAARSFNLMAALQGFTNRNFFRSLAIVHARANPTERVMDGWTGLGLFRLPAYYYGFLHPEILMILSPEEKGERLLKSLKERPPAVIIRDSYFSYLSEEVQEYIRSEYRVFENTWLAGDNVQILYRREGAR